MRRTLLFVVVAFVVPGTLGAQEEGGRSKPGAAASSSSQSSDVEATNRPASAPAAKRSSPPALTPEREAAAMTFVRQHHAELVELLVFLKEQQPAAYRQAVLDLFRASERLAQQKEQSDDARYEYELSLWKIQSRIELLAARLKMAGRDSPEGQALVAQLKSLLGERHVLRKERLALDRQKSLERAERLERQLAAMEANRDQAIDRELSRLVGAAAQNKATPKATPNKTTQKNDAPRDER